MSKGLSPTQWDFIGIDPGPQNSAIVVLRANGSVQGHYDWTNEKICAGIRALEGNVIVAIEDMDPYGQRIGHETMATLKWIGRFVEAAPLSATVYQITRREVKRHLCGITTAKDGDVRDALIQRYGPGREAAVGKKKTPGLLYGITGHQWAALAVAATCLDRINGDTDVAVQTN